MGILAMVSTFACKSIAAPVMPSIE